MSSESVHEKKTESKLFRFVYLPPCTCHSRRRDVRSLPEPSLRGPTNHPDLVSDDHGIHQIIGVELCFDVLQVLSDRALTDALPSRNLFGNLAHGPTLKDAGLSLREEWARVGAHERLRQGPNDHLELL